MQEIVVYVDQGVDGAALKHTVKSLQNEVDLSEYRIRRADAAALKGSDWEEKTALLVIPGGRDIYYHDALDGEGTERIRRFVEAGGSYLGICAGAYFAAGAIEFEKGGSFEVCAKRSLGFFPGLAEGPAYGKSKYRPDALSGVEAASLAWGKEAPFHTYFNGGCRFLDPQKHPSISVLASYNELEGSPAAVVLCPAGKGRAVLSGVHLEYSAGYLYRANPHIERIYPLLARSEEARKGAFREILRLLDLDLAKKC